MCVHGMHSGRSRSGLVTIEVRLARPPEQERQPCQPGGARAEKCQLHLVAGSIHDDALLLAEDFAYGRFPSPLVLRLTTRSPPTGKARAWIPLLAGMYSTSDGSA